MCKVVVVFPLLVRREYKKPTCLAVVVSSEADACKLPKMGNERNQH